MYKYLTLIVVCTLLLTGCGENDRNKTLTCIVGLDEEKITMTYSFRDGRVYLLDWTINMQSNLVEDSEIYRKMFLKINDIAGCTGTFTKNSDGTYTTNQICNLSKMSNEDVRAVYMQDKIDLEQTRQEIIDYYSTFDPRVKCE